MQFLTPLFWLGALAITVPIILHLVRREKTTRLPFASLMFLRRIPVKELRRRRLSHILLLCLRCLGILLLVLAFARPVVTGAWSYQSNPLAARSVVILIDRSLSMSRGPVWEAAIEAAARKIRSLRSTDEGLIIQFGESVEALSGWENSPDRLQEILRTQVRSSFERTSYEEALRTAVHQLDGAENAQQEIYLITDLQQAGMSAAGWKVPQDTFVEIEDVGAESLNLFVEEARLERTFFTTLYPHPILVRVRGNPKQEISGEAQLFVNGSLADRRNFTMGPEGSANLTFKPFDAGEGIARGKIVLDLADDLATDNSFYFVVERRQPQRIAILQDRGEGPAFHLQTALSSGENLPFEVELVDAPPKLDPVSTPLVILNDLRRPPRASLFQEYLENGGGVIIILSNDVDAQAYNRDWKDLLPVELVSRNFVRGQNKPFTSITDVNWDHPVFTIFRESQKTGIASAQFYSYWQLAPKDGASVLARFSEGHPALLEKSVGKGKVLVFASSVDPVWTDFAMRSTYVPFWYRMAYYAAGWQSAPAAFRINHVLPVDDSLREKNVGSSGTWNLIDPRGQRVLGLNEEQPNFVKLEIPGYYELRHQKETDWVAVNSPPEESDFTRVPIEEFMAVFVPLDARSQTTAATETSQGKERQQSLWWLFLIAAAVVFLGEAWIANRIRPAVPVRVESGAKT